MPAPRINLKGRRFGRLRVLEFDAIRSESAYWWCECDCTPGERISVKATRLMTGKTDCGCLGYRRDVNRHKAARNQISARKRRAIATAGAQARWLRESTKPNPKPAAPATQ